MAVNNDIHSSYLDKETTRSIQRDAESNEIGAGA